MLASSWSKIETQRFHSIPMTDHFRKAIELAPSNFLMIYHDDDLLLPSCLQAMFSQLIADPALSGVAFKKSFFFADGTQGSCMAPGHYWLKVTIAYTFINSYTNSWAGGAMPFSGYMYRTRCLKGTYVEPSRGAKYSDITFFFLSWCKGHFSSLAIYILFNVSTKVLIAPNSRITRNSRWFALLEEISGLANLVLHTKMTSRCITASILVFNLLCQVYSV